MASNHPLAISPQSSSRFDEQEWILRIRSSLEEEIEEDNVSTPVSIFSVPKALMSSKPEAYIPQMFAIGPYHHWRPQVYEMERYKITTGKRIQTRLNGLKLQELVKQFMKHEHRIRSHYHRHLDLSGETLAWMMAIDTSFLLEFLDNYTRKDREVRDETTTSLSMRKDYVRMKMSYNMILRDVTMLENQIPLFLLKKLLNLLCPSKELAEDQLSNTLASFIKEVSPFKTMENLSLTDNITSHAHLLELLYCSIMLTPEDILDESNEDMEEHGENDMKELKIVDASNVKRAVKWAWKSMSDLNHGPFRYLKQAIVSRPVKLLVKLPWKVISTIPVISIIKQPVEGFFTQQSTEELKSEEETSHINRPPLVEEITIPSVTDLAGAGVMFSPTRGDIKAIEFDTKTVTLYLPIVTLDVNIEVVLRNLVAYEASVVSGPLVFTRYTELMNGIVDTEEDVRILRGSGIIVNRMKSDKEAAALWNGMSKSVRLTKVGFLDKVIGDVNKYYRSRWKVKSKEFLKKYVFGSWQVLTFLAASLLLLLSCVQAFCSVYSCNSLVSNISNTGE